MQNNNLSLLHDCAVRQVRYEYTDAAGHTLRLLLRCPELGEPQWRQWDNKDLLIVAANVFLFRYEAWGYTDGADTLESWDVGVSARTRAELADLRSRGLAVPTGLYTGKFTSGSTIELICDAVSVEVVQAQVE